MQKQNDLRVIRTRQMIKDAFFKLMDTVGFSKITAANIAEKAFISRNTFYLHYTDKFDLLNQLENEILEELKECLTEFPFEGIVAEDIPDDKPYSVILRAFEFIKENQYFFTLLEGKNGDPAFFNKLHDTIKSVMINKQLINNLKMPERYAIAMAIGGHTAIINEWIGSGMKETPQELASMITPIFKGISHKLFEPKA